MAGSAWVLGAGASRVPYTRNVSSLRAAPLTSLVGLGFVLTFLLAVAAPASLRWVAAKEGPLELLSHAVLLAGVVVYLVRARRAPRWIPLLIALWAGVVLGEELDWGAVLGVGPASEGANLHNAWGGASYLLFALPWLLLYSAALAPPSWGLPKRWSGQLPPRDHAGAFVLIAVVAAATVSPGLADWESSLDEVGETLLYALLLASGLSTSVKT